MRQARRSIGRRVGRWLTMAAVMLSLSSFAGSAQAEEFVLGPGDKLSVTVHKRPDLSGEFRVLPTGALSLPFVQSLPVAGKTVTEVRDALVQRFKDEAYLLDPRVSIDIVEPRPIAVAGDVRRPGSYPFQLGMTVLHAISAAGGVRTIDLEAFAAQAEIGRMRERLRQSQEATGLALIRRSRLLAEQADADDFTVPDGATNNLAAARIRESSEAERALMQQRLASYRGQLNVLGRQVAVFEEEIQALTDQGEAKVREHELMRQEIAYVTDLLQKGLTPRTSRLIELQRLAVQIEGERRQIAAAIAKAKQEIARIEQTRLLLTSQRSLEITGMLKEADDALSTLRTTIEELRLSLRNADEIVPLPGQPMLAETSASGFTILRRRGDETRTLPARGDTQVQPGDLIDVARR